MRKSTLYKFFSVLLLAVAIISLSSCSGKPEEPERDYVSELRNVDKLTLAEMTVTKMGTVDDLRPEDAHGVGQTLKSWLNSLKIGNRKGAWSYSTYMRAYVDMAQLAPKDVIVDKEHNLIRVNMPEIKVEFAGRDVDMHEEHYRVTGLRSNIGAAERARLKEEMNGILKKEVEERPQFRDQLIESARAKGEEYFKTLASAAGYQIELTWKN